MSEETNTEPPSYQKEYPIKQSLEHKASRRSFAKFIGLAAATVAGGYFAKEAILKKPIPTGRVKVTTVDDMKVGQTRIFHYPNDHSPCILVKRKDTGDTATDYVAYSQLCTHLSCPVHYNQSDDQILCPCHHGFFNAEDGTVIAGPPKRALPKYPVSSDGKNIWVGA